MMRSMESTIETTERSLSRGVEVDQSAPRCPVY